MSEGAFFQDLAILMAIAGIAAIIFARLKWPKVLGYIAAGVLMSGYTWGGSFLRDTESVRTIGQLGVVFLMFAMGLSFSARDLKRIRSVALPSAIVDTVVMIWLGYTIGRRVFGWGAVQSFFLGIAICDSATTLLAKVMDELGWRNRPFVKYVLGTSVCEDIICVGAIAVATGFAAGGGMSAGAFALSLGELAVFFLAVLVFGLVFVPRLLDSIAKWKDGEALLLAILGACFFVSYLAYRFDYSLALGAFLIGFIGASSEVKNKIVAFVEPLKSMFAAMFFVSIGLLVDPSALLRYLPQILLVSAVVVVGKALNNSIAALVCGLDVKAAVQHGFSLAQIGEFAFMVAILYAGIVGDSENPLFQIAVGASLVTTLLNPIMVGVSDRAGDMVERLVPARAKEHLEAYRTWLAKIGASKGSVAFLAFRSAATKLVLYAVLMFAVATTCVLVTRLDFSRFSAFVERYDELIGFVFANFFVVVLLPMIIFATRAMGDALAEMLAGSDTSSRWLNSLRELVRYIVRVAVLAVFFMEWTMINVSLAPKGVWPLWIVLAIIIATAIIGWRFFLKTGRRAATRFVEALSAEERREGLKKTMTVEVPEGTFHVFTLEAASPAIGGTVVSLDIRAKTGASIVSVERAGKITRNIGPEWEFAVGDKLVALGENAQIAALKDLLGITS